jgi:hypothetical protein
MSMKLNIHKHGLLKGYRGLVGRWSLFGIVWGIKLVPSTSTWLHAAATQQLSFLPPDFSPSTLSALPFHEGYFYFPCIFNYTQRFLLWTTIRSLPMGIRGQERPMSELFQTSNLNASIIYSEKGKAESTTLFGFMEVNRPKGRQQKLT